MQLANVRKCRKLVCVLDGLHTPPPASQGRRLTSERSCLMRKPLFPPASVPDWSLGDASPELVHDLLMRRLIYKLRFGERLEKRIPDVANRPPENHI